VKSKNCQRITELIAQLVFSRMADEPRLIPREVDLSHQFEVSRSTIRSALQTLKAKGIIERVSGSGTRIRPMACWNILDPEVIGWVSKYGTADDLLEQQLLDFRMAIEPLVASIAAQHASIQDLSAIEHALTGMANTAERDAVWLGKDHLAYDILFHQSIYRATNNVVWSQLVAILAPSISALIEKSHLGAPELQLSVSCHRAVLEAIRLRQPDKAFAAAMRVLELTKSDLQRTDAPIKVAPSGSGY
jgi:GntR family galactonate operon transcriptional repressor